MSKTPPVQSSTQLKKYQSQQRLLLHSPVMATVQSTQSATNETLKAIKSITDLKLPVDKSLAELKTSVD